MKIAHINMVHNGSTGIIMLGIARMAEQEGMECRTYSPIVYQRHSKKKPEPIVNHVTWGSRFENGIHYYLGSLMGINGMLSRRGTSRLLRDLDDFAPDILHLHNLHNFTVNLPLLFRYIKKKNIKVVWTLHDCWTFTGHCPYFDMVQCSRWQQECGHCPQKYIYPRTFLDTTRKMLRKKKELFLGVENMTLVTPSNWLADLVRKSFMRDYPVRVIRNGIDLAVFRPIHRAVKEKYGCEGKFLLLGVAFDWGRRKGLDVFIELSQRLDDRYQIMLVGTDDVVDAQLPEGILSLHRTENQDELAQLYSAADLFVNPTREENYPTVNMEALSCGTPVITFRTGGSPEIVDETCGKVVEVDDIQSLESQIRDICENGLLTEENCLRRARAFDKQRNFAEYVELYRTLQEKTEEV